MALQKRIIVDLHGILRYLPQLTLRKRRPHRSGCVFRAKIFIRDLHRKRCRFQKLIVSAVGLDESALDAAFKNAGKHQALGDCHVSRQHPDPMDLFGIRINICQRKRKRHQRQPADSLRVRDTAFCHDHKKRERRTKELPAEHEEISSLITVRSVRQNAGRKGKHPLMQIVC